MRKKGQLDLTDHRIWKDKHIKPECKRIYAYLHSIGYGGSEFYINIGDIQQDIRIKNVGFRNNLKMIEKFKYLVYDEFDTGMYEIHIY